MRGSVSSWIGRRRPRSWTSEPFGTIEHARADRNGTAPAARREGAGMALLPDGEAGTRNQRAHRVGIRFRRNAAAPLGSVLVPGLRLRARLRLALERRHHDRDAARSRRAFAVSSTSSGSMPAAARARRPGTLPPRSLPPASGCRSIRGLSSMRAGCRPRSTARRCRTATSSITTHSSSPRRATGASSSRG